MLDRSADLRAAVDFADRHGSSDDIRSLYLRAWPQNSPEYEAAAGAWDAVMAMRAHQAEQDAAWRAAHPVNAPASDPSDALRAAWSAHQTGAVTPSGIAGEVPVKLQRVRGDEYADEVGISAADFFGSRP